MLIRRQNENIFLLNHFVIVLTSVLLFSIIIIIITRILFAYQKLTKNQTFQDKTYMASESTRRRSDVSSPRNGERAWLNVKPIPGWQKLIKLLPNPSLSAHCKNSTQTLSGHQNSRGGLCCRIAFIHNVTSFRNNVYYSYLPVHQYTYT